uniref:Poly [ADP-ribose] polymerase 3 n=1 Tax=Anthurium amnicola TaxID=1678845 RepID=A0A1D1YCM7_9ARAE
MGVDHSPTNSRKRLKTSESQEKMHHPHFVSYDSPRRMNYMKFAEYLQKCKVIKHNMPIDVILESCEVKSFDTTLSEEDKKLCIEMQLHRLALIDLAEQQKIYRKWLLEENVVADIYVETLEEIFKSHHNLFPHLPEFTIKGALRRHACFFVEADEVKTGLSKDTREEIDKDIEKHYEYEVARAYKVCYRIGLCDYIKLFY